MQKLISLTLYSGFCILLIFCPVSLSQTEEVNSITDKLQNTFNNKLIPEFPNLFSKQIAKDLKKQYIYFMNAFPNAKWIIKPDSKLKGNRQIINILIEGERQTSTHKYSLISNQKLAIETEKGKIINTQLLSNYSIVQSGSNPLEITIQIPDEVLTGSKYDIDIILNKPLEDKIIAGGLIAEDREYFDNKKTKDINLKPIASGGLFKSVRAPLNPGKQTWSALIAHPEGLVTVTKMVRVISNKDD